ncbi:lysophospholipid acyltransferase family protein [Pontibacter silvestris]|uniref:Lysophospholipid acyltransferase family protein n=1 Tax=Pontibacter silvestris TaxID=2305183 RepID=A0ABW4WV06_9BACT|nr:GNAT family N-acyltransferase [Pontibacter silvestris]MCC9137853.1 lysophospholipid acyltransferase family protein [Pontibacter silvestris]
MEIITNQQQFTSASLSKLKATYLSPLLMQFLKLKDLNQLYSTINAYEGLQFVDEVLNQFDIKLDVHPHDLANIPATGGFITVANHPYGTLDGLILMKLFAHTRPDFKIMANHQLMQVSNLHKLLVSVNPLKQQHLDSSISSLEESLRQLQNDMPLGIFPAGEPASYKAGASQAADSQWHSSIEHLIHKAKVHVIPVYISGDTSLSSSMLGYLNPLLRTAQLPAQLMSKKGKTIKVHIGEPIAYNKLHAFPENQLLEYVRAKTYALGKDFNKEQANVLQQLESYTVPEVVVAEIDKKVILKELSLLPESAKLFVHQNMEVYIASQEQAPNIVQELGRLRELSLRAIGEGTNKAIDQDEYDAYYQHLFLYDRDARLIVGAYRLGKGKSIYKKYGKQGFYLHSLFKMKDKLVPTLKASVEIGRSFVREEYVSEPLPLLLLWKGITTYLEKRPSYRYLIGSVNISNTFTNTSKMQLVDLITSHFYDLKLAKYVQTRKSFRYRLCKEHYEKMLFQQKPFTKDLLEKLMADIDIEHTTISLPVKKYLKYNARIIGFNMDPKLSNSLHGFMVMDIGAMPAIITKMLQQYTT